MRFSRSFINGIEIFTGENDHIKFKIAPVIGGKIVSVYNKHLHKEFLWTNKNLLLETHQTGADYDTNFFGGIDELMPNVIPENIDSIGYPDHGELWTTSLDHQLFEDKICLYGTLKLSGLYYSKTVYLAEDSSIIYLKYTIRNESNSQRNFLWKMHAALSIEEGDQLITDAHKAKVADQAYSRFSELSEFKWPLIQHIDASIVPFENNGIDFFTCMISNNQK